MTASGGACRAIASAIPAVSALLTVTSTTPASAKILGSSDSVSWRATILLLKALEARQPEPVASISWITRGRASNVTRRPAAASMPPTKQPMLPAPATPIGLSGSFRILRRKPGFDSRLSFARPFEAAARRGGVAAPCNRHGAPLCFAAGRHAAGDDDGLTRCTQRHAERSARPQQSKRAIAAAECRR